MAVAERAHDAYLLAALRLERLADPIRQADAGRAITRSTRALRHRVGSRERTLRGQRACRPAHDVT